MKILGCGSAYYAGLAGALMIEALSRIPADAETASEFRYRNPVIDPDALYVAVSQSGETFDTLAAVQEVKRKGGQVLGVVNAPGSTIAAECGQGVYIHAGPEVSITSTKSFTSTAIAFALLGLHLGRVRDLGPSDGMRLVDARWIVLASHSWSERQPGQAGRLRERSGQGDREPLDGDIPRQQHDL